MFVPIRLQCMSVSACHCLPASVAPHTRGVKSTLRSKWRSLVMIGRWLAALVLLGCAASQAIAAEVEVRLVAADVRDQPPVSQFVDFRRSPDGGLIAVQWVSGVKLGDR